MAEKGIQLDHSTSMRQVHQTLLRLKKGNRYLKPTSDS